MGSGTGVSFVCFLVRDSHDPLKRTRSVRVVIVSSTPFPSHISKTVRRRP